MKIRYESNPLIWAECAALITKFFYAKAHEDDKTEAYDPEEFLRGFAERRQLAYEKVSRYAEALKALYADVAQKAETLSEEYRDFFFRSNKRSGTSLSSTLAIALDYNIDLRQITDINRWERMRFYLALGTVSDDGYPDNGVTEYTEENFLYCLDHCGVDAGERWNAYSVYRRTDYYLDLMQEILEPFTEIYRRYLPDLRPLFEETLELAQKNLADDPKSALAQHYFLALDVEELTVRPQTAIMLGASMWIMDPSLGIDNLFVIGCCFDALRALWAGSEDLVNGLSMQIKALDDKRRFQILLALKEKPLCGQEICALTGLTAATVSHHMNELVSARFVSLEKVGTRINYRLRPEVIADFIDTLKRILL